MLNSSRLSQGDLGELLDKSLIAANCANRKVCDRLSGELSLHRECDSARRCRCTRSAGHGHGVSSRRRTGNACTSAAVTTTSSSTCKHTASEGHKERQHSKHHAQSGPPFRNTEEHQAGKGRATSRVPWCSWAFGKSQGGARCRCGAYGERGRSGRCVGNTHRTGRAKAQRGQILGTGWAGSDSRRQDYATGETSKRSQCDGRCVPACCTAGNGDSCSAEREALD